jgi:uncharacterized MAPEG superfamily protein
LPITLERPGLNLGAIFLGRQTYFWANVEMADVARHSVGPVETALYAKPETGAEIMQIQGAAVSMDAYTLSVIGVLALCLLSILLASYSGSSKGRAGALSGPVLPADDNNRLYRIDRAHMNSVEALAPFVVPAVLAMMVGVGPITLEVLVWAHVVIRLIHLTVYLRGGNAAKGGSVRTILYVSGALVNLVLVVVTGWAAIY